jgi:ssDNA-binding Zn-finger/Zn-ribbon topoisomerase 1
MELQELTTEQEKAYLANSGEQCPKCGSKMIRGDSLEHHGDVVWQNVDCECGAYWTDKYQLKEITNFNEKDEENECLQQ